MSNVFSNWVPVVDDRDKDFEKFSEKELMDWVTEVVNASMWDGIFVCTSKNSFTYDTISETRCKKNLNTENLGAKELMINGISCLVIYNDDIQDGHVEEVSIIDPTNEDVLVYGDCAIVALNQKKHICSITPDEMDEIASCFITMMYPKKMGRIFRPMSMSVLNASGPYPMFLDESW